MPSTDGQDSLPSRPSSKLPKMLTTQLVGRRPKDPSTHRLSQTSVPARYRSHRSRPLSAHPSGHSAGNLSPFGRDFTIYRTLFVHFLSPFTLHRQLCSVSALHSTVPVTFTPNVERCHTSIIPSPLRSAMCSVHGFFNPLIGPRPKRNLCESSPASFPLPVRVSFLPPQVEPPLILVTILQGMSLEPRVFIRPKLPRIVSVSIPQAACAEPSYIHTLLYASDPDPTLSRVLLDMSPWVYPLS